MRPLKKFWKKVKKYHKKKYNELFTGFNDPILKRLEDTENNISTKNAFEEMVALKDIAK